MAVWRLFTASGIIRSTYNPDQSLYRPMKRYQNFEDSRLTLPQGTRTFLHDLVIGVNSLRQSDLVAGELFAASVQDSGLVLSARKLMYDYCLSGLAQPMGTGNVNQRGGKSVAQRVFMDSGVVVIMISRCSIAMEAWCRKWRGAPRRQLSCHVVFARPTLTC